MTNFYHLADDKDNSEGRMNCWHCGTELIWGGDHSMEDINDGEESEYDFFSNFTCPKCQAYVEVYHHK